MGIVKIGETGEVAAGGKGRFYIASAPAHRTCPSRLITRADAKEVHLGEAENSDKGIIRQFLHPDVMESCQLTLDYSSLVEGSVWNTIPSHTHTRRMEAYLYWGMSDDARVLQMMAKPQETRHLFVANEQGVVSPSWSIHSGVGIGGYTLTWVMCGDNMDFTDLDFTQPKDMK